MEVILREDVPDLGIIGEIVEVKPGFARNFLIPKGLAVPADRRNVKQLEHDQGIIELKKQRERGTYESLAKQLGELKLEIEARAGRKGKLFGSVTNIDVHRLLEEKGFDIDRRRIELKDPIKEIGQFEVTLRVRQDITTTLALAVTPLGGELEDESPDGEEEIPEPPPIFQQADDEVSEESSSSDDASEEGSTDKKEDDATS